MILNVNDKAPKLFGLVLAGGRSVRMGHDKSVTAWHGKEQRYYAADLLAACCEEVYISCRWEQESEIDPAYKTLPDTVEGSGPLVAILSALRAQPHVAWLVVACDLPLLDAATLRYLVDNRNAGDIATTFKSPHDGLPEPLITIWEPGSHDILISHIAEGYKCPRKALMKNMDRVQVLEAPNPDALMNANTPEDAERVERLLRQG